MLIYFKKVTLKDAEFSRWVKVYRKTKIALACLGTILSFRMYKLFYSGIFGIDSCLARFDKPDRALMKIQKWLGFVSLAVVYATLVAAAIVVFYNVKWGYQALVEAIEVLIFAVVFLILHILERRYDTNPCSDQEYIQIGMKKYGDDVTMAGVPLNYGDSIREREEERDVALRKQALASIIASVSTYSKNGLFSNENLDTCRVKPSMRRAFSYKHLPVIQEEEGESSDEEADYYYKPRRKRRFSIGTEKHLEHYADKKFFSAIDDIRSGKYLPNNVYADSHPEREIPEEARLLNVERATQTDDNDLKLLWRLSRTIPPFKLADILGEFEMDPSGMFIIIRDGGKLKDKHGRLVNTRGYLVDEEGNVIHQNGTIIFHKEELDENNEIPAPFLLDEDEFDILTKPQLIPQPKTKPRKPPKPPAPKQFKKKEIESFIKPQSRDSKRSKDQLVPKERLSSVMTDHPKFDKASIESSRMSDKIRPITSDTKRPATTKKVIKRAAPMVGNFTEDKTIKVKEETSDFDSNFGLEKAPAPKRHQNFLLNETEDGDSDYKETKDRYPEGFFKDYLLNQRPAYYGDTSDIMSRSRKLQY